MALLEIKNLSKSFGDLQVLKDINIQVEKGEVIVIIGPSGSGKSTMLRCCNLLEKPTVGQIIYKGEDITGLGKKVKNYRKSVGMVFQRFNLFVNKTVLDNVTIAPIQLNKLPKAEAEAKALDLLDKEALIRILTEPKSAIVKQYQKLLELDGVKLEFDRDALTAIAETTLKRKTGARGLRAIMEKIMMDTMFRVPSDETIKECRITKDAVLGTGEPLYLRDGEERRSFLTSESA